MTMRLISVRAPRRRLGVTTRTLASARVRRSFSAASTPTISVGVIGVGQMGTAMLKAFLDMVSTGGVAPGITVSDISAAALERAGNLAGVTVTTENCDVAREHDVLLIGTEPEDVSHVLAEISPVLQDNVGRSPSRSRACLDAKETFCVRISS